MTIFPIHPETLKTLYANGHITAAALTAIAPIQWLAKHYPELLKNAEDVIQAIAIAEEKQRTCKGCVNFSSIHQCCMTRIDESSSYLPVTEISRACQDYEEVSLPYFLQRRGSDG